jgi:sugar O-acyltransferase (sialic acid O-acetyltransferase NeuD family)
VSRIVVVGGGGHAKVLIGILKKTDWDIAGYTDRQDKGAILGTAYLGGDEILPELLEAGGRWSAIIGLGKTDVSTARSRLLDRVVSLGFHVPVVVSPNAVINDEVDIGLGTVVFDGSIVNSGTIIGVGCILNTSTTVEHDCRLGDNVHVAPGATISGGVRIGANCMIGTGANVIQDVTICGDCLIGAGSTVVRDILTSGSYAGNPARKIR